MKPSLLHLRLALASALSSACLLAGCATEQPLVNDRAAERNYEFLYPRQQYDSLTPWQQRRLEEQALQDENWNERK